MYYSWLDRWDENRARRGDDVKRITKLALNPVLAFPGAASGADLKAFCDLAEKAAVESDTFFGLPDVLPQEAGDDVFLRFPSQISTATAENNMVHAKLTRAKPCSHAVLVFHHWNATSRNAGLARFLARRGLAVFEIAMPYHLERSRPGSSHADHMLSPNLGRTVQSIRQAVVDGRQLVQLLRRAGYRKVSVLGISLGSWVACLVATHEPMVEKASLLLNAGDLAEMVWTGRATRHIRASLDGKIGLPELQRAWAPFNLEHHADRLARPGLELQFVLARRDKVVLPELSERLVQRLEEVGGMPDVLRLNCGHYSLTLPPYILLTGMSVARFLTR